MCCIMSDTTPLRLPGPDITVGPVTILTRIHPVPCMGIPCSSARAALCGSQSLHRSTWRVEGAKSGGYSRAQSEAPPLRSILVIHSWFSANGRRWASVLSAAFAFSCCFDGESGARFPRTQRRRFTPMSTPHLSLADLINSPLN
jgi:hypothetical protein